ncbi:MAG: DUF6491 family protein [Asticcacaulis sp.]
MKTQVKTVMIAAAIGAAGLAGLSLLPAQARSAAEDSKPAAKSNPNRCFRSDDIDRFNPVDTRTMVIETYAHQHYKLTLAGGCMGIEDALRIGVKTRGGTSYICGSFDADILYNELGSGGLGKCAVIEVTPIDKAEADRLEGIKPKDGASSSSASKEGR